jgi:hypothetical protein
MERMPPTFWSTAAAILAISATLSAIQVVVEDDLSRRLVRAALTVVLLLSAALCVRKWQSERDL